VAEPWALARRTLDGCYRFVMPRWNFLSIPATSRLGGIDRVKFDEPCKMIEFEAGIRPLKALQALRDEVGNRIGPELAGLKPAVDATPQFFAASCSLQPPPRACASGALVARTGRL
jgi:hypothetical protein